MKNINNQLRLKLEFISNAEISRLSGISRQNISAWMKGKDIGLVQARKIACSFGYEICLTLKLKV